MSANSQLVSAITPLGYVPEYGEYTGKSDTYITFNLADDRGGFFADGMVQDGITAFQIHIFAPLERNILSLIKNVKKAVEAAGFTYPTASYLEEKETKKQHFILECEIESEV